MSTAADRAKFKGVGFAIFSAIFAFPMLAHAIARLLA